ncbi:MAG: sialate O-acetylesterase [Akkermansia sp.]|nr:sialate O-acetylesterase [Akkermansia sp.]
MKLRLPHKFQTALMAALASVSFTTLSSGTLAVATGAALLAGQQAQAADEDSTTFTTTNTGGRSNSNFSAYGYIITLNGARLATTPSDVPITTYNEVNLVSVTGNLRYQTGTSGVNTGLALTDSTGKILALSTDSTNTNNTAFTWHFDEGTTVSTDSPLYFLFYKTNNANIEVGYTFKSGDAWQAGAGTGGVYTYSNSADMTSCTFVSSGVGGTLTPPTASNQLVHAPYISIVTTGTVAADEYTWSATGISAEWDEATSNWTFKGAPGTYKSGTDNIVNFNDGAYAKEVTVVGAIEAGTVHVNANYEFTVGSEASLSARTLDVASGATATVGGAGALSIGNVTVASGATATVGGAGALSIGNVTGAGSFVVGSGTLTLANLSLGTGSTLGLGENAHVTITSKPTLSGLNVTLATGSVLDLSGNSSDASDIRNIMGNVKGAGTVKINGAGERSFPGGGTTTLLTNLEFISSAEFNGTGWQNPAGHTFNVGNGTDIGSIKVTNDLRLESQMHINVKEGSSLTVGGNLIMGHTTAGNPGHVDVDHGTLSVGHIQFQDNSTVNTITLADSTVEATQAGNLFASTGTSSTVSATNVTLKATDVNWAWNRAIAFGGTLAVDAGTHTITLGAAGADFSVVNPITLTSGTVAFAGNWNLSGITHTGTTQYTGGATEGDVNGFASLVTSIQLVDMGASTHIGDTSGAHFTIDGVTATLGDTGLAQTSGQVDYATFHVMTGSENVSQGRKDSHDPVYSLAAGAKLVVDDALNGSQLSREDSSTDNATLEIKSGNTYTSDGIVKHVTITGEGTYALKSGTTAMVDSLASEWTGAVRISGSANNLDLSSGTRLYNDHSSVILDGYTGFFKQASQTIAADVEIGAGGITLTNGWGASVITFTGALTGSGNINRNNNANVSPDLRFTGDVSGYTGSIVNSRNDGWGLRLTYSGSANQIKAAEIKNATGATGTIAIDLQAADTVVDSVISRGSGTININVGTTQAPITATFNKEVSASALTINSNSTATFKENLTLSGSLTLDGSATLEKGGSVGGSIDLPHGGDAHGTLTLAAEQNLTYGSSFWGANNNKLLLGAGATVQKASNAPVTIEGLAVAEGAESYVSSSSNEQLLLDKSAFTLHNVKATINTDSADVQLHFDNSKFVTSHMVTLKNLQSVFSGMDIQGGTTTVGASVASDTTVTLGAVALSGGNLTLAEHVIGSAGSLNVTASGTVTGGTLAMGNLITMGEGATLTLSNTVVDVSALPAAGGESHGYVDGTTGDNGFSSLVANVQLVNFSDGATVVNNGASFVKDGNIGTLQLDSTGDYYGYVQFNSPTYTAYYVNTPGSTESLQHAIETASAKGGVTLESVYLNAGTLNADVDTKVASLHIHETAGVTPGDVSIIGTAANFGTVSGNGTLNVAAATTLTADTLSIAADETLTLAGSEHISFGTITNRGTLGIGTGTKVATSNAITVGSGETFTTTGAGTLASSSTLTVQGGTATLGSKSEWSVITIGNGSLTINADTTVSGNLNVGDGDGKRSGNITVAQDATLTANKLNTPWGFNSMTINGVFNATEQFSLNTGAHEYQITGTGTINTKELIIQNRTSKAIFSGGLTINIGDNGIKGSQPLELRDVTVGVLAGSNGWSASRAITLGSADTGTTFNIGNGKAVTLGGVLSGSGKMNVTGGGTVALNGGNSFSGGLTVTGATVEMGDNNALGNANNAITIGQDGVIDLKGHDNVTYAYTLAGGTLQNTGSATGAGKKQTKGLTLTANSTIGGTGDFQIIAGDYAATTINLGNNTLTKTGDNTVHFVNSTITEGTVQVDAGALDFRTDHGVSTVKANIVLNGSGTALTDGFKYADSETAVSRALAANQDVTASAAIELGSNVTLATNVATGKTLTMSGAITGNGGLTKGGDGTLALTAAASYNGNTAVNAGNLALGSSLTTTGNVTVAAGAAITFANGATISANSMTLTNGATLDFSDYKSSIGSEIHVVTTTTGVTGYDGAIITGPTAPRGMQANVEQKGNDIVLTFQAKEGATMHLYILTGQSNSMGTSKDVPLPQGMLDAYSTEGGMLWNGNMNKATQASPGGSRYVENPTWQSVLPQLPELSRNGKSSLCMGPEYGFTYMMLQKGWFSENAENDSLGVMKASLDGGGNSFWVKDGSISNYGLIVDSMQRAIKQAHDMGYSTLSVDGLMYLQGESDGGDSSLAGTRFAAFLENLTNDLDAWKQAQGIEVALVFSGNAVTGENFSNNTTSQIFLDAATSDGKINADMNGRGHVLTKDLEGIGDGLHYTGNSQLTIGARYAYAFAVQKGINVGAVRGQDDSKTLDQAGAWWMEKLPGETEVATWDISSVSTVNNIAAGATLTVGGIKIDEVYHEGATAKGQGSIAINGGTVSLGAGGINLVGGDLSMTSDVTVRENQTWQAAEGLKLAVNGTTTIGTDATLTLKDDLYLTFGYITGTGSLEIGTVTFDMDLDYMGTMAQASYISSKGEGANGYVNEVNLIDLTAGDGTITFTHGGGVNDITKRGGLADCTLTLGEDSKTLKVTMPSTAPKTVYFTRSGEVTYTSTDDGENGIYNATELVLSGQQGAPATLTLSTALKSGVGIKAEGLGGTVKIGSDVVLNASSLETDGAPVTIAGSGEYVGKTLGAVGSVTAADVLGQGVTLASDWTGSVVLSGGNASFTGYTGMGNLADFYKAGSTIVFNGMYGYFSDSYTIGADIEFRGTGVDGTGAALTYTAGNQKTDEFSGTITGKGDFVFDKNAGTGETIKFTGDIAGWEGSITTGNHGSGPLNLTLGGKVTDVNAAITKGQNHPINVTVDATSAVSFNKALTGLSNLTLNANKSASVLGGIGTNATTLNGGASLTIGGTDTTNTLGTVTVNGTGSSLTINQAATITGVTLSNNASTTVTNNVAGTSLGNVTLNNNTALTIGGTAAVAAGNVKLADQCAASIILDNDFSVSQLDTIGGEKTLSIGSAVGVTKTLTTGALGFDNFNTVIALQNVNMVVTGAATVGELDAHSNNIGTMLVGSGATLNLQGTTQWNTSDNKYVDLVIENGGAVNVTNGTENKLRGVNLGADSSLTFGTGTTTIGGAVVLANTITNDGSVTLTGTVNLDALTALTEDEGYDEGEHDGNGFYYNSSTVRVFTENRVGVVDSSAATITYKGVGGTFDAQAGTFTGNGQKDMTTFHVRADGTTEKYTTAFDFAGENLTTVKLADATAINLNKADAALAHLVLTEDASATVQVSENASVASVEGVGAGQTLTVTGTTGKVLTLSADNTMEGTVDVQGGTLKTTTGTALGNAHVDVAAVGTLELGANLTLANGMDNAGTVNLTNKALTLNGREGGTAYTMGTLSNGASSDVTLNNHVTATFDKDASVRRLTGNAGSAVVVGENATLTLTSTNRNSYYSLVGDLDVQGTLKLKGSNGDIRLAGYEDDQVFNLGHLDIDGASGITYMLTSGSVNYTTDIVVKSLSGGGTGHTLQVTTCYTGGNAGTGKVVNFILGDETSAASAPAYTGTIQYGTGSSYVKTGGGMNLVIKDEYVAANAVLQSTMSGGTYATVTVDTARAQVKGLKDATTGKTVNVRGTEADKNRVLEITGDDNYTYNGKLGANLDVVHSGSGTQSFGGVDGFDGSIDVEAGTLNIMNIAQAASVSAQDVTINNSNLGVYTNATAAEENVGALTVKGTLTASGADAKLNANLVMDAGSTLDVSAYGGTGGLNMGCSVTLNPGMSLSTKDMENVAGLGFMEAYDLYYDVESFFIGTQQYSEITFASETWVKANEVFNNDLFKTEGKDYYVFYSGVNPGGNGSNVGTVYIVQVPEPTTSTLSLLALCALAARRRRK